MPPTLNYGQVGCGRFRSPTLALSLMPSAQSENMSTISSTDTVQKPVYVQPSGDISGRIPFELADVGAMKLGRKCVYFVRLEAKKAVTVQNFLQEIACGKC